MLIYHFKKLATGLNFHYFDPVHTRVFVFATSSKRNDLIKE